MTLGDFSAQADVYQRSRPGYPGQLLAALLAEAAIGPGDKVVDLGAGTGIFTRLLVERGLSVTAIEPNEAMMQQADRSATRWIKGTFEAIPLPDQSQRWGVAAQAFHWADPQLALPEIRRILKPDSLFTVIWNNRAPESSEIVAWTESLIQKHIPEFDEAYRRKNWSGVLESTGNFTFLSHHVTAHTVIMSRERYVALWRSHNRLNNIAGEQRFALFLNELENYLHHHQIDQISVPYRCEAWSARRRD